MAQNGKDGTGNLHPAAHNRLVQLLASESPCGSAAVKSSVRSTQLVSFFTSCLLLSEDPIPSGTRCVQ